MKKERQEDNNMSVTHKIGLFTDGKRKVQSAFKRRVQDGFFQGLKSELKKVSWTSKDELKTCTKIVVGFTFSFGLGIYVIDLLIRQCLSGVHVLARLVFGA